MCIRDRLEATHAALFRERAMDSGGAAPVWPRSVGCPALGAWRRPALLAEAVDSGFAVAHDTYNSLGIATRRGAVMYVLSSAHADVGARLFCVPLAAQTTGSVPRGGPAADWLDESGRPVVGGAPKSSFAVATDLGDLTAACGDSANLVVQGLSLIHI